MNLQSIVNLLTLRQLKGSRTQYSILLFGGVNWLQVHGFIHLTPEQLTTFNEFIKWAMAYFFSDKFSNTTSK